MSQVTTRSRRRNPSQHGQRLQHAKLQDHALLLLAMVADPELDEPGTWRLVSLVGVDARAAVVIQMTKSSTEAKADLAYSSSLGKSVNEQTMQATHEVPSFSRHLTSMTRYGQEITCGLGVLSCSFFLCAYPIACALGDRPATESHLTEALIENNMGTSNSCCEPPPRRSLWLHLGT